MYNMHNNVQECKINKHDFIAITCFTLLPQSSLFIPLLLFTENTVKYSYKVENIINQIHNGLSEYSHTYLGRFVFTLPLWWWRHVWCHPEGSLMWPPLGRNMWKKCIPRNTKWLLVIIINNFMMHLKQNDCTV